MTIFFVGYFAVHEPCMMLLFTTISRSFISLDIYQSICNGYPNINRRRNRRNQQTIIGCLIIHVCVAYSYGGY